MSLDDYISSKRTGTRGSYDKNRRPSPRRSAVWNREGIDGQWKHDLFEESPQPVKDFKRSSRAVGGRSFTTANNVRVTMKNTTAPVEDEVRLHIKNLPGDLVEQDILDMFKDFHSIDRVMHFDGKGAFLGEADVYFNNNSDAVTALKHYNKCEIDGAPLNLMLVNNAGEVQEPVKAVSIADRLSFGPKKILREGPVKTIFKKNYGAPQKKFFPRRNNEKRRSKPYNDSSFLDRLADDVEFQKEQKIKRETQDLDRQLDEYMGKKTRKALGAMRMDTD